MLIHRLIGIALTVSHLPCTDNDKYIWAYSITRRFLEWCTNWCTFCACWQWPTDT